MIRFWGSKVRIGKRMAVGILELMQHYGLRFDCVVENFCGIGGLTLPLNEILPQDVSFVASDKDFGVIGFLKAIQTGWRPEKCTITDREFRALKETKEDKTPMHVLIGHGACFNGKYFADHFQSYTNSKLGAACRKIDKLAHLTQGVQFETKDYRDYKPREWNNCLFICDSPYRAIKQYYDCQLSTHFQGFNFEEYADWVRQMSKTNYVICCEYEMDPDFASIWELDTIHNNKSNLSKTKTERLFVWNDPSCLFVKHARQPSLQEWKHKYPGPYTVLKNKSAPVNPCFGMQNVYEDKPTKSLIVQKSQAAKVVAFLKSFNKV